MADDVRLFLLVRLSNGVLLPVHRDNAANYAADIASGRIVAAGPDKKAIRAANRLLSGNCQ